MSHPKRRFELVDDKSRKFWEIWTAGAEVHTAYGRIGTAGQSTVKDEGSDAAAAKLAEKLVREKTKKGYVEVGAAPATKAAEADPLARLAELAAVDAVDEDGDELLGLADLEVLATREARDNEAAALVALGVVAPPGTLTPLVRHGSGSLVVGWQPDATSAMRAVWIDSEGDPRAVFARSMEEMFTLLPHGLGYLYDCLRAAQTGAKHGRASACDVEAWTSAGFPPHRDPAGAVREAHRDAPSFEAWLEQPGKGAGQPATPASSGSASPASEDPDAVEWRIVHGADLSDDEKRELVGALLEATSFRDPALAVAAFRWALDDRLTSDDVDGDTITYHLIRMLELTPDDDALLFEYLRAVADADYAYTDRRLGDLAKLPGVSPARAKRLALGGTFVEGWCLEISRTRPTPPNWVADALRRSFRLAVELGATESDWLAMRDELITARIASDDRPDAGEMRLWTAEG
jgi:predicted DNA-binding WGR domain protein